MDYASAGVDIQKGDAFAEFIAGQKSRAVSKGIGGFAGGIPIDLSRYTSPVMLSTTDGVGTKLLVAKQLQQYDTVGIDLVAMCVNDLAAAGADPISFLDYIACGGIRDDILQPVIQGIIAGCEQAGCTLVGGETAEMPDMYAPDDIDLAGFAVGIADADQLLPQEDILPGDSIFGLASNGIHSNGLSLARKAIPETDLELRRELLVPTRIYVSELARLRASGLVKAAAHITGGGLVANTERVLPQGLSVAAGFDWPVPPIFDRIQQAGSIETAEMRRVFNMGVGMTIVVRETSAFREYAQANGIELIEVGTVTAGE
ncbi:phosphoribosylformylglycinamidine cyclo-ligase [Spirochaeta africana]|uniref:Phosphoribosylformylglycinamidine cyclo-ligase n=1 Tax=Spirochaeta africana (strain ATCC 700263 / DSM 8902 / Z-7692) TaxID=889378 RepID=H9UKG2_SPIAZ|nr:phosphoribosylformylglycinamidine cyclo-ligase [Spirochaeta africana]AFG38005.1 phosphoribosylaminoimidazole synthetase [Spirochaeta africana DSM 8902]